MNNPALKREVSINKMLTLTNPRLRRFDVVVNSFGSCVADAPKEFSRTPEMSISEMSSEPGVFFEKAKSRIPLKQLQSFRNTHRRRKFDEQVNVVNSDMQFIDFASLSVSNLSQEKLTIHPQAVKLEGVFGIFNFPDKMESILSKAMLPRFQIHFLSPKSATRKRAHANLTFNSGGLVSRPSDTNHLEILNFEDGDSSPNLKIWVSSPWM